MNDAVPDPAHFSLREAILAANSHPGQDVIRFALPNTDRTIEPLSELPDITDPVIIDGDSQPGYAGLPLVELDGAMAGPVDGLTITGGGSIVRGLVINRFQNGVTLDGLGGNQIEGNLLGTDVTGTMVPPNQPTGVNVSDSPDNLIGGTTVAERNVIIGVRINGDQATGNRVEGNYIDVDVTGTALLLGTSASGVALTQTSSNTVGGLDPGAGNLIAGSIFIGRGTANVVQGNLIGTDFTGTVRLTQGVGSSAPGGVSIDANSSQNQIGGTTAAARNIIPGGLDIDGNSNTVEGNYIGTDISGTVALPGLSSFEDVSNNSGGVILEGSRNIVGGTDPGAGNLISGFTDSGVGLGGSFNSLEGNLIGTDATGTRPLGNMIGVTGRGFNNTIGGTYPGAGNVISGNKTYGLRMVGSGGNTIEGNFIGTDRTGTLALGNGTVFVGQGNGVYVSEPNDVIGGSTPGSANVISGNGGDGVDIDVLCRASERGRHPGKLHRHRRDRNEAARQWRRWRRHPCEPE